ncbi:MAG: hypothetical protein LIO90_01570 [Bacteroidales bacterium]|nr:hypothetical protein [Bacteroidales bacterium]
MPTVALTIRKSEVLAEVVATTSYAGAKLEADLSAYERVAATVADGPQLERYWQEARAGLCSALRRVLVEEGMVGDEYRVELEVSASFDEALVPTMVESLGSYMAQAIIGRWYLLANREDAAGMLAGSQQMLADLLRTAYHKRRPSRPSYPA